MFAAQSHLETRSPTAKYASDNKPHEKNASTSNPHWQSLALNPIPLQPQLAVTENGDAHEQEADRAASHAINALSNATSNSPNAHHIANAARALSTNSNKAHHIAPAAPAPSTLAPPIVHQALHSAGQPLDHDTRSFMESQLGHDFSAVRTHTDSDSAEANNALQSHALTSGHDIAFGAGQFAPHTREGNRLIAHELTHVAQQAKSGAAVSQPIVQRSPALSSRNTTDHIDDSVASDIDQAIAESATIRKYFDAKSLKKTAGHISVDDPVVYAKKYETYAKQHKDMPDVKDVPGYTDRKSGVIELKLNSADVEAVLHEAVHLNSSELFAKNFGHALNEGVTEYFAEKILSEQGLSGGRAYRDEYKLAQQLVATFNEEQVANAYFKGDHTMYKAILAKFSASNTTGFATWRKNVLSDKKADWDNAAQQLKTLFAGLHESL